MTGILITFDLASMAFLVWAMLTGYIGMPIRTHIIIALGATALSVFAHCLIMMYMVAVGRMIREAVEKAGLNTEYVQQSKSYRKRVMRVGLIAMVAVMLNTILGGGAHTHAFPLYVHHILAIIAILTNGYSVYLEVRFLIANHLLGHRVAREFESAGKRGSVS
jgi:hypothetical protein